MGDRSRLHATSVGLAIVLTLTKLYIATLSSYVRIVSHAGLITFDHQGLADKAKLYTVVFFSQVTGIFWCSIDEGPLFVHEVSPYTNYRTKYYLKV